jgi:hypothetical protein
LNGDQIKQYSPWTNKRIVSSSSKKYSPNLKEDVYQLTFWLENLTCNDSNINNNKITSFFAINPKYKETESIIEIEKLYLGNDKKAEWGDQFTVKVNIYKGDETKYSVKLWAEKGSDKISKTTKFNLRDPYKDYSLTIPIQLKPNCNEKIKSGKATLVLEAFGLKEEKEFKIEGVDKEVCKDWLKYIKKQEKKETTTKINHEITEIPISIHEDEVFQIKLQITNENEEHDYSVWSYLYRGSKCYSCENSERESNKQIIRLKGNEVKVIDLLVKADREIKEGEYKVKVKIQKDNQKTTKDITTNIFIKEKNNETANEKNNETNEENTTKEHRLPSGITGMTVYESSSAKAKKLVPYILIVALILVIFILVLRK